MVAALQIELVRLGVFGVAPRRELLLLAAQPRPELVENLAGDVFLHGEQIGLRAVVLVAPELRARVDVHQLGLNDQPIAAHARRGP